MRHEDLPPFLRVEQAQELNQLGRSQLYEQTRRWRETNGAEGIPVVASAAACGFRRRRCCALPFSRSTVPARGTAMPPEVRIEHRYPAAFGFLCQHGPQALAVLHDLIARADDVGGRLVVEASTRGVAERLGFLSKDSVHRRLRQLTRAGVIEALDRGSGSAFGPTTYVVHLEHSGITVVAGDGLSA